MAAVEITISGVLYDKYNRTQQNVVLIGEAMITGLHVGGGPMPPGEGKPPGIWGGGNEPFPTPPIHLPPDRPKPPEPIQPPIEWKAVWHPTEGWVVVGIPTGPHPSPSGTNPTPPAAGRRGT